MGRKGLGSKGRGLCYEARVSYRESKRREVGEKLLERVVHTLTERPRRGGEVRPELVVGSCVVDELGDSSARQVDLSHLRSPHVVVGDVDEHGFLVQDAEVLGGQVPAGKMGGL